MLINILVFVLIVKFKMNKEINWNVMEGLPLIELKIIKYLRLIR